ncbi:MAG: hypothetical protein H6631_15605 [Anaerolineaceae bacterium]|nr:hypothetical protein [Anaerolineaceae bacterium]MCB9098981.1 hypothetical protein [Anaerolineales bacterium]
MIKHKQAIQSTVSAILLALFLTVIPLTFSNHIEAASSKAYKADIPNRPSLLALIQANDTSLAIASIKDRQDNDISPLTGLLAGSFGVAVVGMVSIIVLRLGPEK